MSLVKKLLWREDVLCGLLKASAVELQANVKALNQLLTEGSPAASLGTLLHTRVREQEIKGEIDLLLCQGSRTRLDHADVELLARVLNRIAKGMRKFAQRFLIYAQRMEGVSFSEELGMLSSMTEVLKALVAGVDGGLRVSGAKARNNDLQELEGQADRLLLEKTVALYRGQEDPARALMLKDLYEQLDRIFDRCGAAGDLVLQIVLKQS